MSGLGGLNKSANGIVIGLVQLQNPVVETKDQLAAQTQRVVDLVGKARRNNAATDLVVFPEYALHGLSMSTDPEIMCELDGPRWRRWLTHARSTGYGVASRSWSATREVIRTTRA